jgi:CRISPR-associated endonuclease Csn1
MNAPGAQPPSNLELAFDVGHSSIGWAVFENDAELKIKGCGVVIFRADDCLASKRRDFRRQRRHIRSTRQRIRRMKTLLRHLGALTQQQLDKPGCAWPWKLAAKVLVSNGAHTLSWPELWDVLRWYAHNRGYDANRRWSGAEVDAQEEQEDAEKLKTAKNLLQKHGVQTMAETFCKELGIDPLGQKSASTVRFKGLNAAFPREIVEEEVRRILRAHLGKLKGVDENLERALCGRDSRDKDAWQAIPCPDIHLPERYEGGLLFGQLVPRFDNRIISKCPITGQKVPARNGREFLEFRWAMQLANVKVAATGNGPLRPLTADERRQVDTKMREKGALTPTEFKEAVRVATGCVRDNLETMLMHPDAREALTLDPVQKALTSDERIAALFAKLPARIQKRARGQLRRGKTITLGQLRDHALAVGESVTDFDEELGRQLNAAAAKKRKKDAGISRESLLARPLHVEKLSGRAAYSREILRKACEEVMAGKHPKEEGGCLFVTEQMRQAQIQRDIDQQINNHLVRHRLKILERLFHDIIAEYAGGDKSRIGRITIEVNRDLREFSGKTAKEKAQDLGLRIADHHRVAEKLQKALAGQTLNGQPIRIGPALIRKARIAEDLGWTCPYTGQKYEPIDLVTRRVDKDHIVPRSQRASDSLDSMVITFSAINKWKGKRTALKFVEDEQGKPVPDLPNLSIVSLSRYRDFVEKLDTFKGHDQDKKRKKRRKALLLVRDYEEEEFTPRDLTQTSQLVRLGAQMLKRPFLREKHQPVITSMPGSVTGEVRKGWNLLGCLSKACPQVLDENGEVRTKTEIREITHLHHALDACVLGLATHFIPNNGRIWELIVKRNLTDTEKLQLRALGIFDFSPEGFRLKELPDELKNQIRERLAERRVVQHVPKRMTGLRVEQNAWRVVKIEGDEAIIRQRMRQPDGSRPVKETTERVTKLFGLNPVGGSGKLKALKAALIIPENFGIALDPEPTIIPFHKVWPRLQELKKTNGGKWPRVLRNGHLIHVPKGRYQGTWRVFSSKATLTLDLGVPDKVRLESKGEGQKREVQLRTLLRDGMTILDTPLTGVASPVR